MHTFSRFLTIAIATAFLAGCGTYSSDMTINGTRTISKGEAGSKRSLKTSSKIFFEDGKLTEFDSGTVIELSETNDQGTTTGELREADGELSLFIQHDGEFKPATDAETKWLDSFMAALAIDDREENAVESFADEGKVEEENP